MAFERRLHVCDRRRTLTPQNLVSDCPAQHVGGDVSANGIRREYDERRKKSRNLEPNFDL